MKLLFELNESKDGLVLINGKQIVGKVEIPPMADFCGKTYPVTEIGRFINKDNCHQSVSIIVPDTVTTLRKALSRTVTS